MQRVGGVVDDGGQFGQSPPLPHHLDRVQGTSTDWAGSFLSVKKKKKQLEEIYKQVMLLFLCESLIDIFSQPGPGKKHFFAICSWSRR